MREKAIKWWFTVPHLEQHELTVLIIGEGRSYKMLTGLEIEKIYKYIKL